MSAAAPTVKVFLGDDLVERLKSIQFCFDAFSDEMDEASVLMKQGQSFAAAYAALEAHESFVDACQQLHDLIDEAMA